jgi:hypothetical protein
MKGNQMKRMMIFLALLMSSTAWSADVKDWTMLVYLNGHNSLDSFGQMNVDQMKSVDNSNVNVVVQWASTSYGKTRRILVENKKVKTIEELAPVDMGDYRSLVEFVRWGVEHYPAKHYFIDVWNHGNGWKLQALDGGFHTEDISYDDIFNSSISMPELGKAMKESAQLMGHAVDVYASDACLMAMIEVNYELQGSVDYVVGSEETEPGAGWPYDKLLTQWGATPADVAKTLVSTYMANYPGQAVTMSAFDLSQQQDVVDAMKGLRAAMESNPAVAKAAAAKSMSFTNSDYVDVGDFLKNYKGAAGTKVKTAMSKYVIAHGGDGSLKAASGLSVWLPTYQMSEINKYHNLQFDLDTAWGSMLEKLWK